MLPTEALERWGWLQRGTKSGRRSPGRDSHNRRVGAVSLKSLASYRGILQFLPVLGIHLEAAGLPVAHGLPKRSRRPDQLNGHHGLVAGQSGSQQKDIRPRMLGWGLKLLQPSVSRHPHGEGSGLVVDVVVRHPTLLTSAPHVFHKRAVTRTDVMNPGENTSRGKAGFVETQVLEILSFSAGRPALPSLELGYFSNFSSLHSAKLPRDDPSGTGTGSLGRWKGPGLCSPRRPSERSLFCIFAQPRRVATRPLVGGRR